MSDIYSKKMVNIWDADNLWTMIPTGSYKRKWTSCDCTYMKALLLIDTCDYMKYLCGNGIYDN
jgi:hypothetical protein